jgi:predicted RNase H-like nuclease
LCEKHVGQRYGRWLVSANSTNLSSKRLGGVALVAEFTRRGFNYDDGLAGPPKSGKCVSECYPYTTIVGYPPFGYDVRPLYKRKPKSFSVSAFRPIRAAACGDLIRRMAKLKQADPPLDLRSHAATRELLTKPSPQDDSSYKHREDLLDAALCGWTASLWHRHAFSACQVLGPGPGIGSPAPTIIAPARQDQRG